MKKGFLKTSKGKAAIALKPQSQPQSFNLPCRSLSSDKDLYAIYKRPKDGEMFAFEFKEVPEPMNQKDLSLEDALIMTSLPPLANTPGGYTQCVIFPGLREAILAQPGFPRPVKTPPDPLVYRLDTSPGKGLGLFTTKSLQMGHHIFSERPLLMIRQPLHFQNKSTILSMSDEEFKVYHLSQGSEYESIINIALQRMSSENREKYRALSNSHTEGPEHVYPLYGILRTNTFAVDPPSLHNLLPGLPQDKDHTVTTISTLLSRINHSCSPNTHIRFDPMSFSFEVYAARDIPAGTEITLTYCGTLAPHTIRRSNLQAFKVACDCPACTNHQLSNARRAQILAMEDAPMTIDFEDNSPAMWLINPSLPDDLPIRQSSECISLIEDEGLEYIDLYGNHLFQLVLAYVALGDEQHAKEMARKARQVYSAYGNADMMEKLCKIEFDPSSDWLWQSRLKLKGRSR